MELRFINVMHFFFMAAGVALIATGRDAAGTMVLCTSAFCAIVYRVIDSTQLDSYREAGASSTSCDPATLKRRQDVLYRLMAYEAARWDVNSIRASGEILRLIDSADYDVDAKLLELRDRLFAEALRG